jgi:phosphate transport system substrate-binding protein
MKNWVLASLCILLAPGLLRAEDAPVLRPAAVDEAVTMKGSDSMDPLIRLWISEFQKTHATVAFKVDSPGSATAPPALAAGEVRLGHMSREMSAGELAAFQSRRGFAPTHLVIAYDALGIYVNRVNPLRRIALGQLDAIYSRTRLSGWDKPVRTWGDMGLGGRWRKKDIRFFGRDEKSGTRAFFDDRILGKGGALRPEYRALDQWGVVEAVAKDSTGIGYGPTNYANPDVKLLPVLAWSGMYYLPTTENVANGRYPLTRKLNLYVAKEPGKPLPPSTLEFLRFILGPQGQRLVQEYGSVPLSAEFAQGQLRDLER